MNHVTDDLLIEILIRLPDSRSAIQCSTVNKRWNSLINHNPQFTRSFNHHRHLRTTAAANSPDFSFLLHNTHSGCFQARPQILELEFHNLSSGERQPCYLDFLPGPTTILAASGDLLLVASADLCTRDYFVCNPLTRTWASLPKDSYCGVPGSPHAFGMICRPAVCDREIGCTDNCEYSFRVVFFYYSADDRMAVSVFSPETLAWTTTVIPPPNIPEEECNCKYCVVACGGILYWLTQLSADGNTRCILAIDPFRERREGQSWHFIAFPWNLNRPNTDPLASVYGYNLSIGVCRDRLRVCRIPLCSYRERTSETAFEAWELGEDFSWQGVDFYSGELLRCYLKVHFHPNDPDVVFVCNFGTVYRCHLPEKMIVKLFDVSNEFSLYSLMVKPYWPTPVPKLSLLK